MGGVGVGGGSRERSDSNFVASLTNRRPRGMENRKEVRKVKSNRCGPPLPCGCLPHEVWQR